MEETPGDTGDETQVQPIRAGQSIKKAGGVKNKKRHTKKEPSK